MAIDRLDPNRARKLLECLRQGLDNETEEQDRFRAAETLSAAVYRSFVSVSSAVFILRMKLFWIITGDSWMLAIGTRWTESTSSINF